jgi:hypothetical protein
MMILSFPNHTPHSSTTVPIGYSTVPEPMKRYNTPQLLLKLPLLSQTLPWIPFSHRTASLTARLRSVITSPSMLGSRARGANALRASAGCHPSRTGYSLSPLLRLLGNTDEDGPSTRKNRLAAARLLLSREYDRSLWYRFCKGHVVQQGTDDKINGESSAEIKRRGLKGGILTIPAIPVSIAVPSD